MTCPPHHHKRAHGQFFTHGNPFVHAPFRQWFESIPGVADKVLLEPFAGANHIVRLMREAGYEQPWKCFDIDPPAPRAEGVPISRKDTLASFPKGFEVVVTNPPYLARNSARRRGIGFPDTRHDDLYKHALAITLDNVGHVAAIIPESFVVSDEFRDRLHATISLTSRMFSDTDCPVCLALFVPSKQGTDFQIWDGGQLLGLHSEFSAILGPASRRHSWRFNDPRGSLGLRGVDDGKTASIRFVRGETIDPSLVKHTSRSITRIGGLPESIDLDRFIAKANAALLDYRARTHDALMTPFKGLRADGKYRRRLDFTAARNLLDHTLFREIKSS